ncbi:iron transporter [Vibrio sp. S4M6]|uniref:iron transporter n=1 Tax=Vibrio sinus TaxID=2946865 RepID=UPI00202A2003|nr:iron transporter [Vibrio sinus]MCL9781842.1 iron transporter [Vibrio sinus]
MKKLIKPVTWTVPLLALASTAAYADHPIAPPKVYQNKIETALIWVEPVSMAPKPTMDNEKWDIHNEVDMHEIKGSTMGFGAGGWIPYANVACTIGKKNSDWRIVFDMMPMVANDGPHYGRNIKLDGPGVYDEMCHIDPPDWNGFFRHTDKETGTSPYFKPYTIKGSFKWLGSGKAGGY